jgi:hypothetical protein
MCGDGPAYASLMRLKQPLRLTSPLGKPFFDSPLQQQHDLTLLGLLNCCVAPTRVRASSYCHGCLSLGFTLV